MCSLLLQPAKSYQKLCLINGHMHQKLLQEKGGGYYSVMLNTECIILLLVVYTIFWTQWLLDNTDFCDICMLTLLDVELCLASGTYAVYH